MTEPLVNGFAVRPEDWLAYFRNSLTQLSPNLVFSLLKALKQHLLFDNELDGFECT